MFLIFVFNNSVKNTLPKELFILLIIMQCEIIYKESTDSTKIFGDRRRYVAMHAKYSECDDHLI